MSFPRIQVWCRAIQVISRIETATWNPCNQVTTGRALKVNWSMIDKKHRAVPLNPYHWGTISSAQLNDRDYNMDSRPARNPIWKRRIKCYMFQALPFESFLTCLTFQFAADHRPQATIRLASRTYKSSLKAAAAAHLTASVSHWGRHHLELHLNPANISNQISSKNLLGYSQLSSSVDTTKQTNPKRIESLQAVNPGAPIFLILTQPTWPIPFSLTVNETWRRI